MLRHRSFPATSSILIHRTSDSARLKQGCSPWLTISPASMASIAADSSKLRLAWPHFVAMNEVYGQLFAVGKAEASTPAMAQERANAVKDQFIMDMHPAPLPPRVVIGSVAFVASVNRAVSKTALAQLRDGRNTTELVRV